MLFVSLYLYFLRQQCFATIEPTYLLARFLGRLVAGAQEILGFPHPGRKFLDDGFAVNLETGSGRIHSTVYH